MKSYLAHYGIKGQQWGVRRFQNEDGSLTAAGKEHYDVGEGESSKNKSGKEPRTRWGKGRKLSNERYNIEIKKTEELNNRSKEYQKNKRDIEKMESKYGFDQVWGKGRNNDPNISKKERNKAYKEYMKKIQDQLAVESKHEEQAHEHANKMIKEKYGDKALKDIKHYESINATAFTAALAGIAIGFISGARRSHKNRIDSANINRYTRLINEADNALKKGNRMI